MTGITSKIDTTPIPPIWRGQLDAQLESGERLIAFFEPDLDGQLEFADGLVVLTDRRLADPAGRPPRASSGAIRYHSGQLAILAIISACRLCGRAKPRGLG